MVQMVPWLHRLGIDSDILFYPHSLADRLALRRRLHHYDAVILQKKLLTSIDLLLWSRLGRPLIFDFDDAIPFRQKARRGNHRSTVRTRRFARTLRRADGVFAGNRYLAFLCTEVQKPVLVSPSPVPYPVASRGERPDNPVACIGWIGGEGNLASLTAIAPILQRLAERRRFRFTVVSDGRFHLDGVEVVNIPWSQEHQEEEIARFDIGIMPLKEATPWSRGKCAYKLLQYMAAGIAPVASPVGMNTEVVEDGVNGLLAADPRGWERCLTRLLDDAPLRLRLGAAGQRTVAEGYTYPVIAEQWRNFLDEAFDLRP